MTEFLINGPEQPMGATLILAHGAGAMMDAPFMNVIAEGLAKAGVKVLRFEFPYMQERRDSGTKRPPNTQKVLFESWRQAVTEAAQVAVGADLLFIGGKSMGGRMASLLADELQPAGLVCLGYPFHALGKPEKPRVEHLKALSIPTLILQGTRDPMGNKDRVEGYDLSEAITVSWLEDGDHDLKPRVKSGLTHQQNMQTAIGLITQFIRSHVLSHAQRSTR